MPELVGPPAPVPPIVQHLERVKAQNAPLHPALQFGPVAASLFDAITTGIAMKRGAQEANPIMAPFAGNDPLLYGTKIASGALTGWAGNKLAKSGHRTAGKIVSGIGIGVPLGAGTHNLMQLRALEGRPH